MQGEWKANAGDDLRDLALTFPKATRKWGAAVPWPAADPRAFALVSKPLPNTPFFSLLLSFLFFLFFCSFSFRSQTFRLVRPSTANGLSFGFCLVSEFQCETCFGVSFFLLEILSIILFFFLSFLTSWLNHKCFQSNDTENLWGPNKK